MQAKDPEAMVIEGLMEAKQRSDTKTILRRRQLERCLQLSHSSNSDEKIQAARNIHIYFSEFGDLEEQVIDAIYDLCEDQSLSVRLEGYRAISRISKADSRFLKRNTDVLFQLLQSDDASEVEVVKEALFDHIEMGARVTFGVLCDQFLPPAADADEEERNTRVHLRALVIDFLEQQVIPRCIKPGSTAEDALFDCLCELVPQLDVDSIQRVVRNVILKLPSYGTLSSPKGDRLVKLLVQRAESESRNAPKPSISSSHPFMETAQNLVINHGAPSLPLLQYYSGSLVNRNFLQQLPNPQKIRAIRNVATLLDFCGRSTSANAEVRQHRLKVVVATPFLIEVLLSAGYVGSSLSTFISLLRNCYQWKTRENWAVPSVLINAISQLQTALVPLQPSTERRELRRMIALVLPSSPQVSTNSQAPAAKAQLSIPSQPTRQHVPPLASRPPFPADSHQADSLAQGPVAAKRKQFEDMTDVRPRQSLFHRLQSSESKPPATSTPPAPLAHGSQGFSIKGAASLPAQGNVGKAPILSSDLLGSRGVKPPSGASFSLLARLADNPTSTSEPRQRKKRRQ